jgi:hypothetical protein
MKRKGKLAWHQNILVKGTGYRQRVRPGCSGIELPPRFAIFQEAIMTNYCFSGQAKQWKRFGD